MRWPEVDGAGPEHRDEADAAHRHLQHRQVEHERRQLADGQVAVAGSGRPRATPSHTMPMAQVKFSSGEYVAWMRFVLYDWPNRFCASSSNFACSHLLAAERLHDAHATEVLLQDDADPALEVLHLQPDRPQQHRHPDRDRGRRRDEQPAHERELPARHDHQRERRDEQHDDVHQPDDAQADEHADALDVLRRALHDLAGLRLVVVREAQPLQVVVDVVADVVRDALGDELARVRLQELEEPARDRRPDDEQRGDQERPRVAGRARRSARQRRSRWRSRQAAARGAGRS